MKRSKTIIFIAFLCPAALLLHAQPVLEHTYTISANICQLESIGDVYYSMDVVNKECGIYTMDHNLYKTIPLPTPQGYYLYNVQYVSENLFNSDDLVELVYTYSMYVETAGSYFYTYETRLINENGNVMLSIPGAGYTSVMETMEDGKKFLVYIYDYSVIPYRTQTQVYALPGSATKSVAPYPASFQMSDPFPNPAASMVHVPVQLPPGILSGTLELIDMHGNRVLSYPVTGPAQDIVLPTHQLAPGTYMYYVESAEGRSPSKKIVVPR
jgi:hypothetical protein